MPAADPPPSAAPRRLRFEPAGTLLARLIRKTGEGRGFSQARLLTDWVEVAGADLARLCRPVRISYAKRGLGATLILEAPGAAAPMLSLRLDTLRARINAVYGYAAISRIQLVQGPGPQAVAGPVVAPGLAEGPALFAHAPPFRSDNLALPSDAARARAQAVVSTLTDGITDPGLKAALDRLAQNLAQSQHAKSQPGRRDAAAPPAPTERT